MQGTMLRAPRPFSTGVAKRSVAASAVRRVVPVEARRLRQAQLRTRSAEVEETPEVVEAQPEVDFVEDMEERGPRRFAREQQPQFKHFLPLPKPAHLIYIKPTVAVVAGTATRSSVGLKMAAGDNQLERYVIEFYSKSVK